MARHILRAATIGLGGCVWLAGAGLVGTPSNAATTLVITTVAGNGTAGYNGDQIPPRSAELFNPEGITGYGAGYIVADRSNDRVRYVTGGQVHTIAGNGTAGYTGDAGPATAAELSAPSDVEAVPDSLGGGFLIADQGDKHIRWVNAQGTITTVAGCVTGFCFSNDGDLATGYGLNNPGGVSMTPDGGFLIANSAGDDIVKVSGLGSTATATAVLSGLNGPQDVVSTGTSTFLVANTNGHTVVRQDGSKVAGTGTETFSGDGGPASAAGLGHPEQLAVRSDGSLLIADRDNDRIRLITNGTITTFAGGGGPQVAPYGDGGAAKSASLTQPAGVYAESGGSVLISDTLHALIRLVSPQSSGGKDTTPPSVTVSAASPQHAGKTIAVHAGCNEACRVSASGALKAGGKSFSISKRTISIAAGAHKSVKLPLSRKARKAATHALRKHHKVLARVTVVGVDTAGNRAAGHKVTVKLTRK